MPPKKSKPKAEVTSQGEQPSKDTKVKNEAPKAANEQPSKKRKKGTSDNDPQKAARRSGRGQAKSQPSQEELLKFLLSKDAEELCRPEDESKDIQSRGNIRTYSGTAMNPFEELLCAAVLSRPISHRLGLRSIRTLLNDPYNFTSAKATKAAGPEKRHQALWDAKTQHKQKTAEQIGQIADVVLDKFTASGDKEGTQLQRALDDNGGDVDKALDSLKEQIKGIGPTGLNIFLRRVQWLWRAGYPYVDDRTMLSLRKLGLPEEAEDLQKALEKHWSKVDKKQIAGNNDAAKKRRAFVIVLERAIGADLEGKMDALIEAAAGEN